MISASERSHDAGAGRAGRLLEIDHVSKEYPLRTGLGLRRDAREVVHAVTDVSFGVDQGEVFGLVGESGCGKSTLARLLVALEEPTAGEIRFGGRPLLAGHRREHKSRRREIQLMFQDPDASLDPRMRIEAIVAEPLAIHRIGNRSERRAQVRQLLESVGMRADLGERFPHELSGGQRQRVGLARALALRPQMIVADEPVSALDVSVQAQVLNLLRELRAQFNLTYVMISHDLAVVRFLADRIGVMYLGSLVELGPAERLYLGPAHHYTAGLVATIPRPVVEDRRRHRAPAVRGELPSPVNPPSGCRFRTRCPRAQERCSVEPPAMRRFGKDHYAACHFPLIDPHPGTGN